MQILLQLRLMLMLLWLEILQFSLWQSAVLADVVSQDTIELNSANIDGKIWHTKSSFEPVCRQNQDSGKNEPPKPCEHQQPDCFKDNHSELLAVILNNNSQSDETIAAINFADNGPVYLNSIRFGNVSVIRQEFLEIWAINGKLKLDDKFCKRAQSFQWMKNVYSITEMCDIMIMDMFNQTLVQCNSLASAIVMRQRKKSVKFESMFLPNENFTANKILLTSMEFDYSVRKPGFFDKREIRIRSEMIAKIQSVANEGSISCNSIFSSMAGDSQKSQAGTTNFISIKNSVSSKNWLALQFKYLISINYVKILNLVDKEYLEQENLESRIVIHSWNNSNLITENDCNASSSSLNHILQTNNIAELGSVDVDVNSSSRWQVVTADALSRGILLQQNNKQMPLNLADVKVFGEVQFELHNFAAELNNKTCITVSWDWIFDEAAQFSIKLDQTNYNFSSEPAKQNICNDQGFDAEFNKTNSLLAFHKPASADLMNNQAKIILPKPKVIAAEVKFNCIELKIEQTELADYLDYSLTCNANTQIQSITNSTMKCCDCEEGKYCDVKLIAKKHELESEAYDQTFLAQMQPPEKIIAEYVHSDTGYTICLSSADDKNISGYYIVTGDANLNITFNQMPYNFSIKSMLDNFTVSTFNNFTKSEPAVIHVMPPKPGRIQMKGTLSGNECYKIKTPANELTLAKSIKITHSVKSDASNCTKWNQENDDADHKCCNLSPGREYTITVTSSIKGLYLTNHATYVILTNLTSLKQNFKLTKISDSAIRVDKLGLNQTKCWIKGKTNKENITDSPFIFTVDPKDKSFTINCTVQDLPQITKEDFIAAVIPPIENLQLVVLNSSCIELTWDHRNISNLKIEYNYTLTNENYFSSLSSTTILCDFKPATNYNLSLRQILKNYFDSEQVTKQFVTEAKPIDGGSAKLNHNETCTEVTWKYTGNEVDNKNNLVEFNVTAGSKSVTVSNYSTKICWAATAKVPRFVEVITKIKDVPHSKTVSLKMILPAPKDFKLVKQNASCILATWRRCRESKLKNLSFTVKFDTNITVDINTTSIHTCHENLKDAISAELSAKKDDFAHSEPTKSFIQLPTPKGAVAVFTSLNCVYLNLTKFADKDITYYVSGDKVNGSKSAEGDLYCTFDENQADRQIFEKVKTLNVQALGNNLRASDVLIVKSYLPSPENLSGKNMNDSCIDLSWNINKIVAVVTAANVDRLKYNVSCSGVPERTTKLSLLCCNLTGTTKHHFSVKAQYDNTDSLVAFADHNTATAQPVGIRAIINSNYEVKFHYTNHLEADNFTIAAGNERFKISSLNESIKLKENSAPNLIITAQKSGFDISPPVNVQIEFESPENVAGVLTTSQSVLVSWSPLSKGSDVLYSVQVGQLPLKNTTKSKLNYTHKKILHEVKVAVTASFKNFFPSQVTVATVNAPSFAWHEFVTKNEYCVTLNFTLPTINGMEVLVSDGKDNQSFDLPEIDICHLRAAALHNFTGRTKLGNYLDGKIISGSQYTTAPAPKNAVAEVESDECTIVKWEEEPEFSVNYTITFNSNDTVKTDNNTYSICDRNLTSILIHIYAEINGVPKSHQVTAVTHLPSPNNLIATTINESCIRLEWSRLKITNISFRINCGNGEVMQENSNKFSCCNLNSNTEYNLTVTSILLASKSTLKANAGISFQLQKTTSPIPKQINTTAVNETTVIVHWTGRSKNPVTYRFSCGNITNETAQNLENDAFKAECTDLPTEEESKIIIKGHVDNFPDSKSISEEIRPTTIRPEFERLEIINDSCIFVKWKRLDREVTILFSQKNQSTTDSECTICLSNRIMENYVHATARAKGFPTSPTVNADIRVKTPIPMQSRTVNESCVEISFKKLDLTSIVYSVSSDQPNGSLCQEIQPGSNSSLIYQCCGLSSATSHGIYVIAKLSTFQNSDSLNYSVKTSSPTPKNAEAEIISSTETVIRWTPINRIGLVRAILIGVSQNPVGGNIIIEEAMNIGYVSRSGLDTALLVDVVVYSEVDGFSRSENVSLSTVSPYPKNILISNQFEEEFTVSWNQSKVKNVTFKVHCPNMTYSIKSNIASPNELTQTCNKLQPATTYKIEIQSIHPDYQSSKIVRFISTSTPAINYSRQLTMSKNESCISIHWKINLLQQISSEVPNRLKAVNYSTGKVNYTVLCDSVGQISATYSPILCCSFTPAMAYRISIIGRLLNYPDSRNYTFVRKTKLPKPRGVRAPVRYDNCVYIYWTEPKLNISISHRARQDKVFRTAQRSPLKHCQLLPGTYYPYNLTTYHINYDESDPYFLEYFTPPPKPENVIAKRLQDDCLTLKWKEHSDVFYKIICPGNQTATQKSPPSYCCNLGTGERVQVSILAMKEGHPDSQTYTIWVEKKSDSNILLLAIICAFPIAALALVFYKVRKQFRNSTDGPRYTVERADDAKSRSKAPTPRAKRQQKKPKRDVRIMNADPYFISYENRTKSMARTR